MIKSYNELINLQTFDEKIEYLKLNSRVGESTFGYNRYINQEFYRSPRWKRTRDKVIIRDDGCDLGVEGYEIFNTVIVHHINSITVENILNDSDILYDLNNLILTSKRSHDYIHYGKKRYNDKIVERSKNDTTPWLL
jgi:hypothetical protein